MTRPKDNTLFVFAAGKDKRRLPLSNSVQIPSDALDSSGQSTSSKKLFRINDTLIPLNILLDSCNIGSSLQIKIVDQTKQLSKSKRVTSRPVVEIIDDNRKNRNNHFHFGPVVNSFENEPKKDTSLINEGESICLL